MTSSCLRAVPGSGLPEDKTRGGMSAGSRGLPLKGSSCKENMKMMTDLCT